jgi:glycosyltransferase involved in cell wall biosynthesis
LAFVHNWAPPYRRGLFELLAAGQGAEFLLFGGRWALGPAGLAKQIAELDAPARQIEQRQVYRELRRGGYRAVLASTNGRIALPSAYAAARRAGVPFVLWATMWRHPRTAAHALSWPGTRWIYTHADAVVTYGPHVSRYVSRFRSGRNVFDAPQALDNDAFGAPVPEADLERVRERTAGRPYVLFVGRLVEQKGIEVLGRAWRRLHEEKHLRDALLVVAGVGPLAARLQALPDTVILGQVHRDGLRAWYARALTLVLPSIRTRSVLETWGYAVNEAFLHGTPAVVTDAVGAAAGGLVEDGVTGLVAPAGEAAALAVALERLLGDPELAGTLGAAARERVGSYTHEAQAAGFERALASCGVAL